ncbi:hypothetical protein LRY60_04150 [Candidatus Woesebacteria bacterium]|nr:hypothetical protein [Candidatus Woesebacteria bacterium]
MSLLTNATHRVLDFLWPPICIGCGRVGTQLCRICGNHLTFWDNSRTGLESLQLSPSLRRVYSAVEYIDDAQKIVKAVKFSGYWTYTTLMAQLIVLQCGHRLRQEKIDVLVPVPIHPRRRRERGFNQTEKTGA